MSKSNFIPNILKLYYKDKHTEYSPENHRDIFSNLINFIEDVNECFPEDNIIDILINTRNKVFNNHKKNPFIAFENEEFFNNNKSNPIYITSKNNTIGIYPVHSPDKLFTYFHLLIDKLSVSLEGFDCIIEQGTKKINLQKESNKISKLNCYFPPQTMNIKFRDINKFYNPYNYNEISKSMTQFISEVIEQYPDISNDITNLINQEYYREKLKKPFMIIRTCEEELYNEYTSVEHFYSKDRNVMVYIDYNVNIQMVILHTFIEELKLFFKDDFDMNLLIGTFKITEEHIPSVQKTEQPTQVINQQTKQSNPPQYASNELLIPNLKSYDKNGHIKQNLILLSNPNSGKTFSVKKMIGNNHYWDLSFQNNDNVLEWKKNLLFKNLKGDVIIGNIIKAIASATLNPSGDYFIFADEIGTFSLDNILGNVLKNIFKNNQKVKISNDIIREYKDNDNISLDEFIELGKKIQSRFKYNTTNFIEEDISIPLWIPSNLNFVFCANYENELLESLSPLKGWGTSGNRFRVKHFYNLNGRDFYALKSSDNKSIHRTKKYNEIIHKKYNELLINEELSSDSKKTLSSHCNQYKILLSNYDVGITQTTAQDDYVIEHITQYIYSLFLDEEDEDIIIQSFKDVL
jgi:hypothetical protein